MARTTRMSFRESVKIYLLTDRIMVQSCTWSALSFISALYFERLVKSCECEVKSIFIFPNSKEEPVNTADDDTREIKKTDI